MSRELDLKIRVFVFSALFALVCLVAATAPIR